MSNYNIPIKNLSVQFTKEQRVFQQLTNKDALIDALLSVYDNTTKCQYKQDTTHKFIQLYKPIYHEIHKSRVSLKDFKLLYKDFVEGAFGKVTIVKSIHDKENIYALKTLNKSYLNQQIDRSSPMEERLILSNQNEEWLPSLYASFQDKKNLYLVMEYAHGGDLENLMERKSYQFNELEAKFYCAELVLAVERVHQLGYMHRDIKPANILIDSKGHIKLGDLGSCISIDTKESLFMVGTMPYISPEMCNFESTVYGPEVDWWSVGIVLYELIYGVTPFTGKDIQIQMNLLNPKVAVKFNPDINISNEAKDLLTRLLLKQKDQRLGINGAQEIKSHPFFKDIDWNTLRTTAIPPFIPSIKSLDDISFFASTNNQDDNDNEEEKDSTDDEIEDLDKDLPYIGYTYSCHALNNIISTSRENQQKSSQTIDKELINLQVQLNEKNNTINSMKQIQDKHDRLLIEKDDIIETQMKKIDQLESKIELLMNDKREQLDTMTLEINHYQEKIPLLEKENNKLLMDTNNLLKKLKDYNIMMDQLKLESTQLKQELQQQQKLKRPNKSLPSIPNTVSPRIISTDHPESRSFIISTMWQRDRESLKNVQQALKISENKLAFEKRQVLRLKKQLKYTFDQSHIKDNSIKLASTSTLPSTPPLDAIQFSPTEISFLNDHDNSLPLEKNYTKKSLPLRDDLIILDQIKMEQNFINSTKRTISARAKLSRNNGEIDDHLKQTLHQANKKLSLLQTKLKNQPKKAN